MDSANGAAVRIAMTVGVRASDANLNDLVDLNTSLDLNAAHGRLLTLIAEEAGEHGEINVILSEREGQIHADLSMGANVASAVALIANGGITSRGVMLFGAGFIVSPDEAATLGFGAVSGLDQHIRDYRNGRDLTDTLRGVKVIDLFGLTADQVREKFPGVYQWLLDRVKPERDTNRDVAIRENWWLHGRTRGEIRRALSGLPRYIATVETAKHRTFQFLDASILPDNMLIAIASDDAFLHGALSSSSHLVWALAQGGTLEDRPRYNKSRCFETFPFPDEDTGLTPALRQHIAAMAEQIDAHRKRQQAAHPGLTLTGMYNVLEVLRQAQDERGDAQDNRPLTAKEKTIYTQGLVSVLKDLHDELDTAVLQAYGLEPGLDNDALLTHLVALNASRTAEEKSGQVRWLRPDFQNPVVNKLLQNQELLTPVRQGLQAEMALETEAKAASGTTSSNNTQPWPANLPEQVRALAQVLAGHVGALTMADIEARFKGRGPWKKSLSRILETLEALGRARREEISGTEIWRA